MKKVLIFTIFLFALVSFGCYKTNINGSLYDVKIFSTDEIELEGSWEEGFHDYSNFGMIKLNSPAPLIYNYFVNVLGYNDLIICFDIYLENDYKVKEIQTNLFTIDVDDFVDIEYKDNHAYCYYKFENINPENKDYVYIDVSKITICNRITGATERGSNYFATRSMNSGICLSFLSDLSKGIIEINNSDIVVYKICSLYDKEDLTLLNADYYEEEDNFIITEENVKYYFKKFNDQYTVYKIESSVDDFPISAWSNRNETDKTVEMYLTNSGYTLDEAKLDVLYEVYKMDNLYIRIDYEHNEKYYVRHITIEYKN